MKAGVRHIICAVLILVGLPVLDACAQLAGVSEPPVRIENLTGGQVGRFTDAHDDVTPKPGNRVYIDNTAAIDAGTLPPQFAGATLIMTFDSNRDTTGATVRTQFDVTYASQVCVWISANNEDIGDWVATDSWVVIDASLTISNLALGDFTPWCKDIAAGATVQLKGNTQSGSVLFPNYFASIQRPINRIPTVSPNKGNFEWCGDWTIPESATNPTACILRVNDCDGAVSLDITDTETGTGVADTHYTALSDTTINWADGVCGNGGNVSVQALAVTGDKTIVFGTTNATAGFTLNAGTPATQTTTIQDTTSAADIFVDCDDSGSLDQGTEAEPYKTLQQGINAATAGDRIEVMNGVCGSGASDRVGNIVGKSGTAGNPITIANYPGHTPQIGRWPAVASEFYGIVAYNGSSYWRLEGLTFRGTRFACLQTSNLENAVDWEVVGNIFDGCGKGETDYTNFSGHVAIFTGRLHDGMLIERNTFANTGRVYNAACDALGQANCHQYRHDHALYLKGWGHIVRNNVFYENNQGYGIKIDGHTRATDFTGTGKGTEFSHVIVLNTFGPNNSQQPYDGRSGNPIHIFRNSENPKYPRFFIGANVFVEPTKCNPTCIEHTAVSFNTGLSSSDSPWDNWCVDNITIGTTADETCVDGTASHAPPNISGNTLMATLGDLDFTDAANHNYRIAATSIAVNYGLSTDPGMTDEDFDQNVRDHAGSDIDAGAFEN